MIIGDKKEYSIIAFRDEEEIEEFVSNHIEWFFGNGALLLPKIVITTVEDFATIPDGIVINFDTGRWYILEVEKASHGIYDHIIPQITKQIIALDNKQMRRKVILLATEYIRNDAARRQSLTASVGGDEMSIQGKIDEVINETNPGIAIPIDEDSEDLRHWAGMQRFPVLIWPISKYLSKAGDVLYEIPDDAVENAPKISGGRTSGIVYGKGELLRLLFDGKYLSDGQHVQMTYGPKGAKKMTFDGWVYSDGIALDKDGEHFSPSRAAVYCIEKTGSRAKAADGWIQWYTDDNKSLDDLSVEYERTKRP